MVISISETDTARGHTWAIELTPPGRGAVAVVLVSGPDAMRSVEQCFTPANGRQLADVPSERIILGRWGHPGGEELIICRRSAEQVEIHCHGGTAAVSAVMERLMELGCRQMAWQEWLRRTCDDPIRAAAQIALANAPTARTAAILLDQHQGSLTGGIQAAAAAIKSADWARGGDAISSVLAHRDVGMHLTTPWRVILIGPTNVGKSSLINSLTGYERSIVSHQPGTTRDVVTTTTAIDGWPVQLADTAGLRDARDALETAGINMAMETAATADLVIMVYDAMQPVAEGYDNTLWSVISNLTHRRRVIPVLNKIDLIPDAQGVVTRAAAGGGRDEKDRHWQSQWPPGAVVRTSAVTGEGIADLVTAIGGALVAHAPAPGSAVPFTSEQVAALEAALAAVEARDAAASLRPLQRLLAPGSNAE
jgi:tRNA modification GTPase